MPGAGGELSAPNGFEGRQWRVSLVAIRTLWFDRKLQDALSPDSHPRPPAATLMAGTGDKPVQVLLSTSSIPYITSSECTQSQMLVTSWPPPSGSPTRVVVGLRKEVALYQFCSARMWWSVFSRCIPPCFCLSCSLATIAFLSSSACCCLPALAWTTCAFPTGRLWGVQVQVEGARVATQVVLLGAGMDTRAWRPDLHLPPGDPPATAPSTIISDTYGYSNSRIQCIKDTNCTANCTAEILRIPQLIPHHPPFLEGFRSKLQSHLHSTSRTPLPASYIQQLSCL